MLAESLDAWFMESEKKTQFGILEPSVDDGVVERL